MKAGLKLLLGMLICTQLFSESGLGIRAQALSGAYRAIATSNDALYFNVGGLSLVERYNPQLNYIYDWRGGKNKLELSLVDSATSKMAAGLAYNLTIDKPGEKTELSHLATFALAYPLWEQVLHGGVSVKYMNDRAEKNEDARFSRVSMDGGLVAILPFGFTLGAAIKNFIPTENTRAPMSVGLGAAVNIGGAHLDTGSKKDMKILGTQHGEAGGFTMSVDYVFDDLLKYAGKIEQSLHAGASYLIMDVAPVRLGYKWSPTHKTHAISGGAGFMTDVFSIEAFYAQGITKPEEKQLGVMMDFYL